MRTPIFYILFFAKRIQAFIKNLKGNKAENATRHVELILCTIHLLSSFVDDLLDFQQIKDGVFTLTPKPFEPVKTFQLVCGMFAPQAEGKQVQILWKSDEQYTLPHKINGDERRLLQVLINLVKISLHYAKSGGAIQIKAGYDRRMQKIQVHICDGGARIILDHVGLKEGENEGTGA